MKHEHIWHRDWHRRLRWCLCGAVVTDVQFIAGNLVTDASGGHD